MTGVKESTERFMIDTGRAWSASHLQLIWKCFRRRRGQGWDQSQRMLVNLDKEEVVGTNTVGESSER